MPKVTYKSNRECVYEVYGAREYSETMREYENEWKETWTELLIYEYNGWIWVDARDYEPYEEDVND